MLFLFGMIVAESIIVPASEATFPVRIWNRNIAGGQQTPLPQAVDIFSLSTS